MRQFIFNGRSSKEFHIGISGTRTFGAPGRDTESIIIPGKNGELTIDNGRYHNQEYPYDAFIVRKLPEKIEEFRNFLLQDSKYHRLEDDYHPDTFRLARYISGLEVETKVLLRSGTFELVFNCKPQRFLKVGEKTINFESAGSIFNPTLYEAKPLIRAYGTGTLFVGNTQVKINSADVYTDIDCEIENCYKGIVNCNNNVEIENFPTLVPGNNNISFSGITKIEITPRWWML